jgi:hypothetical protein
VFHRLQYKEATMRKGVLALVIVAAVLGGSGRATADAAIRQDDPSCIGELARYFAAHGTVPGSAEEVRQFQAVADQQGITFGALLARLAQAHGTFQECLALPPNP